MNMRPAVIQERAHLLLRVGANVRLLKRLGYARENDGTVYLWPDKAAKRQQLPLVLRLVVSHNGRHPVYLLTSVGLDIATERPASRGTLLAPLGNRTLLSKPQTNLSTPETPQRIGPAGPRRTGNGRSSGYGPCHFTRWSKSVAKASHLAA